MKASNRRVIFSALLIAFACLFIIFGAAAEDAPGDFSSAKTLKLNDRLLVMGGQDALYRFTATSNNQYLFKSFSDHPVVGALYGDDGAEAITWGEGFQFETRLIAGETYYLLVKSSALAAGESLAIEVMRSAYGRSFTRPLLLDADHGEYKKVIARAYDTHYYQFVAQRDGLYTLRTESELDTLGYLLDAQGRTLHYSDDVYAPYDKNFFLQAELKAGQTYFVRLTARNDETGDYLLKITAPGESPAQSIQLDVDALTLVDGETAQLTYSLTPADAQADVSFISTDAQVARVSSDGRVTAKNSGTAQIIALIAPGVTSEISVTVEPVAVTGIAFTDQASSLGEGETLFIGYDILPENASNTAVTFESSDPDVASIDSRGEVTAHAQGMAEITARTQDGGFSASITITVHEPAPAYRALVMGERQYADGRTRIGSVNTAQGIADMLRTLAFDSGKYQVNMRIDSTRSEALYQIRRTFSDAKPTDVSLFYINCHGDYKDGVAYLEFHDTKKITAEQLEWELRKIPGLVIVLIDCCQSGSFLSTDAYRFNEAMIQAFQRGAAGSFALDKYIVFTSTSVTQDSYRLSSDGKNNEASMATAFARSFAEAGGWDLITDRRQSMKADLDRDRVVTVHDALLFTRRRVKELLKRTGAHQDVQAFPEQSTFPLFQRN